MSQYKLAVIIPSWNCSQYIGEMLDSILANTYTDWKCFVVDDQSTDDTRDVIQKYAEQDNRIVLKIRDREPKGAQTCRNIGFELTEGAEYVIWFDADDLVAPYCFEHRVAYMDRHHELDFGVFPAKTFKATPWDKETWFYGYHFYQDTLKAMLDRTLPMVGWTNIYRRHSVISHSLKWDTNILSLQDSDWNIQALIKGCTFGYASDEGAQIDYFYRIGNNGISKEIKRSNISNIYYLNKIVRSLSFEQKIKYRNDIKMYHLWIGSLINDKKLILKFFCNPWFLFHLWFGLRFLLIFYISNGKGESKFFPGLFLKNQKSLYQWQQLQNTIQL